jgi:hypothetical protein
MNYDMNLKDQLITISPITEVIPLAGVSEVDLICLSGFHLRSYLTFVKEYIPCDTIKLRDIPGILQTFTIRDKKLGNQALDQFVLMTKENQTSLLVALNKPG